VRLGSARACECEALPDLDALHGLDPHERGAQACVEPIGLLGVGAEAGRDAQAALKILQESGSDFNAARARYYVGLTTAAAVDGRT
jgi:hypothetical protein